MEMEMTEREIPVMCEASHTSNNNNSTNIETSCVASDDPDKIELNDEEFKEFRALFNEAKSITADSSLLTVAQKIAEFILDEKNPFSLLFILMNVFGEGSWEKVIYPFIITILASVAISYYVSNEKREVCRIKQGQKVPSFFKDWMWKMFHLMFACCDERCREMKRKSKIEIIEDNSKFCKELHSGRWVKTNAFIELRKFFSSHLRYLREEMLVITLRSFPLALFTMYKIADLPNMTLRLCKINDYFKLVYVIWVIYKASSATQRFKLAERSYIATDQLWGATWTRNNSTCSIDVPRYDRIQSFESQYWRLPLLLDLSINFILQGTRFFAAIICMLVLGSIGGTVVYFLFLMMANVFLLDVLNFFGKNLRSLFDNPPTGYSKARHIWIDRFMMTIVHNYGYSIHKLKGVFGWKTLYAIPSTVTFLGIIILSKGTLHLSVPSVPNDDSSLTSSHQSTSLFANYSSDFERASFQCSSVDNLRRVPCSCNLSVLEYMQQELSSNSVNVIDYLGGITVCIYIILFSWVIAFILEIIQKYLQHFEKIDLCEFEIFPFIDALDCYRSLNRQFLNISSTRDILTETQTNDIQRTDPESDEIVTAETNRIYTYTKRLMGLTIFDSIDFHRAWSSFRTDKKENFPYKFDEVKEDAIQKRLQELSISFSDVRWTLETVGNSGYDIVISDLENFNMDNSFITSEELVALRLIKNLRKYNHPLEPHSHEDSNHRLISNMFRCIQINACNLHDKRTNIKLFVLFCSLLDIQLSQMSSCRMERTFDMLEVEIGKSYCDEQCQ